MQDIDNDMHWHLRLGEASAAATRLASGKLHLPVRDSSGKIDPLGRWLNEQRRRYNQGTLSAQRREALEATGFDMNPVRGKASQKPRPTDGEPGVQNGCRHVSSLDVLIRERLKYRVIYADPPWRYDNQGTRAATDNHYSTMSSADIAAMPIPDLADTDCFLHLWTTNGFLKDALDIMDAWGFDFKSQAVWVKPQMGLGNYWRLNHELLLLGRKGKPQWKARNLHSAVTFPRGKHSAKPEAFRTMIEQANDGPYLELFGRRAAPGWTVFGNQMPDDLVDRTYLAIG